MAAPGGQTNLRGYAALLAQRSHTRRIVEASGHTAKSSEAAFHTARYARATV
jgi:hypothetical protein